MEHLFFNKFFVPTVNGKAYNQLLLFGSAPNTLAVKSRCLGGESDADPACCQLSAHCLPGAPGRLAA